MACSSLHAESTSAPLLSSSSGSGPGSGSALGFLGARNCQLAADYSDWGLAE